VTATESLRNLEDCLTNRDGGSPCATLYSGVSSSSLSLLQAVDWIHARKAKANVRPNAEHESEQGGFEDPLGREQELSQQIRQSLNQSHILLRSSPCPILAIAGLLNAGKTSLVAGFLSQKGRERLLIGESNSQGTHRFIIWLPQSWRTNSELWKNILAQLESIFEHSPEYLSEDPRVAAKQYNAIDSDRPIDVALSTPLIAADEALDEWNVGLMDCPDIQTGIAPVGSNISAGNAWMANESVFRIADIREKILGHALRIASAFVVVASANSLQDAYVDRILWSASKAMPGLKKILVVNKVPRRYSVQEIAEEIRQGYASHDCWRYYMAYHFDGPIARERLPSIDLNGLENSTEPTKETLPVFFRIDHSDVVQPPAAIPKKDFLNHLGSQLEPSQLSRDIVQVTLKNLRRHCEHAIEKIHNHLTSEGVRHHRLQRVLAEACLSLSYGVQDASQHATGQLPLQVSREIIKQVAISLERTAPWWAKPGRKMTSWIENAKNAAGEVSQWVAFPSWVGDRLKASSDWVRSRWRKGEGGKVISAQAFFDSVAIHDQSGDLIVDEIDDRAAFLPRLSAIIDRFHAESRTRLDESQLNAYTREMWNRMSWRQRMWTGMAPAGMLFAPLLAVMMLPMDFGGSAVLVFASMKELLVASAAGVGMAMLNSDHMPKIAEQETAWQQLSDLYAVTCDEFGVPRIQPDKPIQLRIDNASKPLLSSQLPIQLGSLSEPSSSVLKLAPGFEEIMNVGFSNLERALESGI
jgi:hypothetical protein